MNKRLLSLMLAALLAEDTKPETLRKMLASFLEIQPASPAPAAAPTAAPAKAPEPPAPAETTDDVLNALLGITATDGGETNE